MLYLHRIARFGRSFFELRVVDRYLAREILAPLGVSLSLFFAVVSFAQVLKVSDSVTGLGIGGQDLGLALLYSLPPLLGLLLPVGVLFSVLLGIGRLASDGELLGLQTSGLSWLQLARLPLWVGAVCALLSGIAMMWGEPFGIHGLRRLMATSAERALVAGVHPERFHTWLPGVTLFARKVEGAALEEMLLADMRSPNRPVVVVAQSGDIKRSDRNHNLVIHFNEGSMMAFDENHARAMTFGDGGYRVDVSSLVGNKARNLSPVQELSWRDLWVLHRSEPNLSRRALYTVVWHRKFALPLAALLFVCLAVPLGSNPAAGGRARSFLYSAAIITGYYYLGRALELEARALKFPAVLAAWSPNLAVALAAGWLNLRKHRAGR